MGNLIKEPNKLIITGISIAAGIGLKQLMKKFWVHQYDEDPPGLKESGNLHWGKLFLWTLMTGMILRIVKVAIKRSLFIATKKNKLLT